MKEEECGACGEKIVKHPRPKLYDCQAQLDLLAATMQVERFRVLEQEAQSRLSAANQEEEFWRIRRQFPNA